MPTAPPIFRPPGWQLPRKTTDPFYLTAAWRELRAFVLQRDHGICARGGRSGADTAHHIVERRDGGSDDPANLEAIHRRCHNKAHPGKGRRRD